MITIPLFAALLAASPAAAPQRPVVLAQARAIDVLLDDNGRRVIVDLDTGEVLAVLPPKRGWRDAEGGPPRLLRERLAERYGLDEEPEVLEAPRDVAPRVMPKVAKKPAVRKAPLEAAAHTKDIVTGTATRRSPAPAESQPLPTAPVEAVARLQVLLDRAGLSPGTIDGRPGDNLTKALRAYEQKTGTRLDLADGAAIDRALAAAGGLAFTRYTVTGADVAGPFVASVPEDYGAKAQLDRLGYTSTLELLSERFHMSEAYLKALNPGIRFDRPGTIVTVAAIGRPASGTVSRIIADKGLRQVRAYDGSGRLIAAYPATIGSADTPSPSGSYTVDRVAFDPEYTYDPRKNFKQGNNESVLRIPPGPNGPVGSIWIALSKPTYGIHGTPEPSKIGKTASHGCVRLTNWDADELARMVKPGTTVQFVD